MRPRRWIRHEHADELFKAFQRLHRAEEFPGTGIGLAIVEKAVSRMNGRVGVESEPGKGSRFWVELPFCTREDAEPADAVHDNAQRIVSAR